MTDNPQAPWLRPDPALDTKFPAIGFAPCPGDLRTAERVAKIVRKTARALSDIAHVLNGTGRGEWRGKAAEAFREQFDEDFRPKVIAPLPGVTETKPGSAQVPLPGIAATVVDDEA
ncbi:hypothetical protein AB0O77_34790, partial [Streptomyces albidoflavus]